MSISISDEERARLDEQLKALDTAESKVRYARAPFDEAIAGIEEARAVLLDPVGGEIAGHCENCGRLLFRGEQGSAPFEDETGIIFCAAHGMTYGDLLEAIKDEEEIDDADPDAAARRRDGRELVNDHLAGGGELTDLTPTYAL